MNDNLNACLQHFWGSSYWSQELEKLPELSSEVKSILLAKSVEIDRLRYQLSAAQQSAQACICGNPKSKDAPCCAECIQDKKYALSRKTS